MKLNQYDWQARILPSLLTVIPIVWIANVISLPELSFLSNKYVNGITLSLVLVVSQSYFIRDISKYLQDRIFVKTGLPSVYLFIRYKEYYTKEFYKAYVNSIKKVFGYRISKNDQRSWQEAFDLVLANTRDSKFILQLNIRFGFLRNLIGSLLVSWIFLIIMIVISYYTSNKIVFKQSIFVLLIYSIPLLFLKKILIGSAENFVKKVASDFVSSTKKG